MIALHISQIAGQHRMESSCRTLFSLAAVLGLSACSGGIVADADVASREGCELTLFGRPTVIDSRYGQDNSRATVSQRLRAIAGRPGPLCLAFAGPSIRVEIVDFDDDVVHALANPTSRSIQLDRRLANGLDKEALDAAIVHELVHLAVADAVPGSLMADWYDEGIAHSFAGTVSCEDSLRFQVDVELALAGEQAGSLGEARSLQLLHQLDRFAVANAYSALRRRLNVSTATFHAHARRRGFEWAVLHCTGASVGSVLIDWARAASLFASSVAARVTCTT